MVKHRIFCCAFGLFALVPFGFSSALAGQEPGSVSGSQTPPLDVLIAGGDTVLARWEHDMVGRHGYDWPLEALRELLSSADAALCNLECCVSLRGTPARKGERCPFYYRARPEMLQCLTGAGLDIVTAANNHGGDYGSESVFDTCLWTEKAGLVCVGIGKDLVRARAPRLVRIGRTRVGICGMDTTQRHFRAGEAAPGTHHVGEDDGLGEFTEQMQKLGEWAEGRCELLFLTIHWGDNWTRETPPIHRKMARIAVAHGVDAILGHSAHRLQGIEVLDGRPVVYDMGNLLFDCELKPEGVRSALFRLHLSRSGVHRVEVVPILALNGHSVPAPAREAQEILAEMEELCASLDTRLSRESDRKGRSVGVVDVECPEAARRRSPDRSLKCATFPSERGPFSFPGRGSLGARIPEDARRVNPPATVAPGLELVAVLLPEKATEGGILRLRTWWRVTARVSESTLLAFHLSTSGTTTRRGTPWYTRHDAADWSAPLSRLEVGDVVEDCYPARLSGIPPGSCDVKAVALDSSLPVEKRILGTPCPLGTVVVESRETQ